MPIFLILNKPGTAKVGAIDKIQNCKRGTLRVLWNSSWLQSKKKIEGGTLWWFRKISQKILKIEIIEQCHTAENSKRGTLCDFLTSTVLQNIETNGGRTLWCNPNKFKESRIVPTEKNGARGILSVISRFWRSVGFPLFVLQIRLVEVRSCCEVWRYWTN